MVTFSHFLSSFSEVAFIEFVCLHGYLLFSLSLRIHTWIACAVVGFTFVGVALEIMHRALLGF